MQYDAREISMCPRINAGQTKNGTNFGRKQEFYPRISYLQYK